MEEIFIDEEDDVAVRTDKGTWYFTPLECVCRRLACQISGIFRYMCLRISPS